MDYSKLSTEELHELAYYQEDRQAQQEYMRRVRLLRVRELLEREEKAK